MLIDGGNNKVWWMLLSYWFIVEPVEDWWFVVSCFLSGGEFKLKKEVWLAFRVSLAHSDLSTGPTVTCLSLVLNIL